MKLLLFPLIGREVHWQNLLGENGHLQTNLKVTWPFNSHFRVNLRLNVNLKITII